MGSGASTDRAGSSNSVLRLRKALVIRAYNLRRKDETLHAQFKKFAHQKATSKKDSSVAIINGKSQAGSGALYISMDNIKKCLSLDGRSSPSTDSNGSETCSWVDDLFLYTLGATVTEINFLDFIRFLETGKLPLSINPSSREDSEDITYMSINKAGAVGSSPSADVLHNKRASFDKEGKLPPFPPLGDNSIVGEPDYSVHAANQDEPQEAEDVVHRINLSDTSSLPNSVKLPDRAPVDEYFAYKGSVDEGDEGSNNLSVIVHGSKKNATPRDADDDNQLEPVIKPLWRKREVIRKEKTIHYTTLDEEGQTQELVERETTQTEVLHMECRETGEFAHRETTRYEQTELFNEETVGEVTGTEEYVHLKSLEDEFHYMDSTMPKKEDAEPDPQAQGNNSPRLDSPRNNAEQQANSPRLNDDPRDHVYSPGPGNTDAHGANYMDAPCEGAPFPGPGVEGSYQYPADGSYAPDPHGSPGSPTLVSPLGYPEDDNGESTGGKAHQPYAYSPDPPRFKFDQAYREKVLGLSGDGVEEQMVHTDDDVNEDNDEDNDDINEMLHKNGCPTFRSMNTAKNDANGSDGRYRDREGNMPNSGEAEADAALSEGAEAEDQMIKPTRSYESLHDIDE